jgi:hypothetical protein
MRSCPFCFPARISPAQLLLSTRTFYLLAAAGQIVEGFLCIMTHTCSDGPQRLRCFDDIPQDSVAELQVLRGLVADFYADIYSQSPVFYENGRGGGYDSSLPEGDYKFHPHLCAIPGQLTPHSLLRRFPSLRVTDFPKIRKDIGRRPYLYVHTPADREFPDPLVYYSNDSNDGSLQDLNFKKLLAEKNSLGSRWNWHEKADAAELRRVIDRFGSWYECRFCL